MNIEYIQSFHELKSQAEHNICFFCLTPLHCEYTSIINEYIKPINSILFYTPLLYSKKTEYYKNKMLNNFDIVFYKKHNLTILSDMWLILSIKHFVIKNKISKRVLFIPSYKKAFYRVLISVLSPCKIVSYDEGLANILSTKFRSDEEHNKINKIISFIYPKLKYKYLKENLLNITMFKSQNVFSKNLYLPIIKNNIYTEIIENINIKTSVLLMPSYSIRGFVEKQSEIDFINYIIYNYDINVMIDHPRNPNNYFHIFCNYLTSSQDIAEYQILEMSKFYKVYLFSTPSTTLFTLAPNCNIHKIMFITQMCRYLINNIDEYIQLAKNENISIVYIDI